MRLGQTGRQERAQATNAPVGDSDTRRPARETQRRAFRQQLAHDASSTRAQRDPHGNFPYACRGARQQQMGNVGAGDQEDQADGSQHDQQR